MDEEFENVDRSMYTKRNKNTDDKKEDHNAKENLLKL